MSTGLYGKRRGILLHFQAFSILLIGLLTLGFTSAGATLARGAEISPQIFDQRLDRTEAAGGQPIRFDFKWAVPATAQAGDTFTIQLPNELRVRNSAGFPLLAPDGQTAANAVWSYKTVTFTLTDYVNSNDNVNGSAFFTLEWDSAHVDMSAGAEHMLQFSGSNSWQMPLTLIPDGTPGTGQSLSKVGWWLSGDQGASSMENQLGWVVYLDTGDEQGADTPVIITDTPGSGYQIDLDSVEGFSNGNPLSASRFTAERVGSNGVKIVLVGNYPGEPAVYPGENVYFKYDGDLLPGENGIFTNSATITEGSDDPRIVEAEILRDGAGGDGSGDGRRLTPVAPAVEQAKCTDDGTVTGPSLTLAETGGISYTVVGDIEAGESIHIIATPAKNFTLAETTGWTLNEDGTATFEVVLTTPECETAPPVEDKKAAPDAPEVVQATCNADGTVTDPTVGVAETEGVAYTVDGEVKAGNTVTVTATAQDGFKLTAAGDWTLNEDGTASLTVVLDETDCVVPPVEAAPVAPTVEQATCNADGTVTDPTVGVAETEGVTYKVDGEVKAGNTVTVTATAKDGFKLSEVDGWKLNEDGTASFEVVLESPDCETNPSVEDKETAPVAPVVEQATCNADGSVVDPNLNLATTEGVAYTVDGEVKAGNTVTVTATAQDGFKLTAAGDWTLNED
ncbi:Ig-like domain-containing protein, partial [Glutamicibacter soli]